MLVVLVDIIVSTAHFRSCPVASVCRNFVTGQVRGVRILNNIGTHFRQHIRVMSKLNIIHYAHNILNNIIVNSMRSNAPIRVLPRKYTIRENGRPRINHLEI